MQAATEQKAIAERGTADPKVTFIVPCYRLAHLLPDCIESILAQSCRDFEILIMDDCSPDHTAQVARSFRDPRVHYIRNQENLGHLSNYNKGIGLARGQYIWLISADDRLRRPYVLQRYLDLMEQHPEVGYAFCPGMDLVEGQETQVLPYSVHGDRDAILPGREFLAKLVFRNTIVSPSGMVRRECYDISKFPLDMPWGGDWYLWCLFAFHYDVAYFAEPMVCYRRHNGSMTVLLMDDDLCGCSSEDIALPGRLKQRAEAMGYRSLIEPCLSAAAQEYADRIASKRYRTSHSRLTVEGFERSLEQDTSDPRERNYIRVRTYAAAADHYVWQEEYSLAREFYLRSIRYSPWLLRSWFRFFALSMGNVGIGFRKALLAVRRLKGESPSKG